MTQAFAETGTGRRSPDALHPLLQILVEKFQVPAGELASVMSDLEGGDEQIEQLKHLVMRQRLVTPEIFQQAVAELYGLDYVAHLDDAEISTEFTNAIPIRYAKKFMFFPTRLTDDELWVAVENPEVIDPIEDVGRKFRRVIHPVVSNHPAILALINRAYDRAAASTDQVIDDIDTAEGSDTVGWGIEEPEDLIDAHDEEPIKRLMNNILYQAARANASDVHVDSTPTEVVIRFRVDGVLHGASQLPKSIQRTLINRIKIMSRLDIAQRGLPQDGRTLILIAGRKIDIRVSTIPTVHGEKAVMRLLYQDQNLFGMRRLGMPESIHREMARLIGQTGGMVLVSGPTGSGKTTTLYAALSEIDRHSKNIVTIEDPVEYKIAGYVQTELNPKLGLTFATALRSILRQDPDVIMVGEMRDRETAVIATQAALTGHTVFSTVHTNNAPSTVTRLVDMGVESYLVSSTVMGVLAQRLVRRICEQCKTEQEPDKTLLKEMGFVEAEIAQWDRIHVGRGCTVCQGTGYKGRQGVFELLVMNDPVKEILHQTNEAGRIRDVAMANGMISMRQFGVQMVREGITTIEELMQATRED